MEKIIIIDKFITEIIMTFEMNEVIESILKKIGIMSKKGTVISENNSLKWESKNKENVITVQVDKEQKKLTVEEIEANKSKQTIHNFIKKTIYQEKGAKSINYRYEQKYDIKSLEKNKTQISAKISKRYQYYDKNRFQGTSYEGEEYFVVKDNQNKVLSEQKQKISTVIKALANGDCIKKATVNNKTEYSLYNPNQESYTNVEKILTKEQFDELMSLGNNPFEVINNDIVYKMRGSSIN